MKLKKIVAKLLAVAMIVTGLPIGFNGVEQQVFAETVDETGDGQTLTNIAEGRYVTVSASSGEDTFLAGNAVDGKADTKWKSAAVSASAGQWLQIDLESWETSVEEIKVMFADKAWSTDYTVSTASRLADDAWTTVARVQKDDAEEESHVDSITRNNATEGRDEKIVLHRYVRFNFAGVSSHAADSKIVIAEIEINSPGFVDVRGPKVAVPAPVSGEYPQIAEITAPDNAVHHEDVADRTTNQKETDKPLPLASLIKAATGTVTTKNYTVDGAAVEDKVRENGELVSSGVAFPADAYGANSVNTDVSGYSDAVAKLNADANGFAFLQKDGVLGFSGLIQTPGSVNKFDVYEDDLKIISLQLFLAKKPTTEYKIFGKGSKYYLCVDAQKLCLTMEAETGWKEEAYWLDSAKNCYYPGDSEFFGTWHDILIVVDGVGRQRLYVDGDAARTKKGGAAIAKESTERTPFVFGYGPNREGGVENGAFTMDGGAPAGYIARFKFYANKDYYGMINGAGTDISDAAILSEEFDTTNAATDSSKFSILNLEAKVGAADNNSDDNEGNNPNNDPKENLDKKSKVYDIITNMLQDENPTARITLCPYSRSTVWYAYDDNAKKWNQMPAYGEGAVFADGVKYRAQTRLMADTGFKFGSESRAQVIQKLESDGTSSVKITNNSRELLVTTYFNCTEEELKNPEIATDDVECDITRFATEADALELTVGESKTMNEPYSEVSACANHTGQVSVKTEYTLVENGEAVSGNDGTYLKLEVNENSKALIITPKASTKNMVGDAAVAIKVTGTLVDQAGKPVSNTDGEIVKETEIFVKVNPETVTLSTPPAITLEAPEVGVFPKTAEIRVPGAKDEEHHTDVADRMEPTATFQPMDSIPSGVTPSIENKDGVWGFNAWGQTPSYQNKFDVLGTDVKVIAYKFYLKEFPGTGTNDYQSIFGKGNQYAMQIDNTKLNLFMHNGSDWIEQQYIIPDKQSFVGTWHDIFVIVDGKGKMRFYVDGNRSADKKAGDAYSDDSITNRKPFSFGYNLGDGNPQRQMFKNGYIADMEFYTNKDYYGVINGAGTDISDANILSAELAANLSIAELEREYADRPEDLNRLITNLLQSENATVDLSISPYTAKTVWSQKVGDDWEEPDPNAQFGALSEAKAIVTLTAHEGFKFPTEQSAKTAMENAVKEQLSAEDADTDAKLDADSKTVTISADGKTMTVEAAFTPTADAPCTCAIEELTLPESRISIEIPADKESTVADDKLTDLNAADITTEIVRKTNCLKAGHNHGAYSFAYVVSEADKEVVDIVTPATPQASSGKISLAAYKKGTAAINVTATYTVAEAEGVDPVTKTKTESIAVTVTKAGEADPGELAQLGAAADQAAEDYPDSIKDDYNTEEWDALQEAIREARELAVNPKATAAQVLAANQKLQEAITALADAKSPKGLAKDALKAVLENAELKALIEGNNSDKKYTADSFGKLTAAYAEAESKLATADKDTLDSLKTALVTAWEGLDGEKPGGGTSGETGDESVIKDGTELTGADGTKYQVVSGKDMTVTITKGVDAKTIKVGPTVTIGKDTFRVIGIGSKAYTGLKKATKVIINANVASIGDQAFAKSKKLKNVTIGANVTTIGKKAFFNCPKLNKVILKGTGLTNKSFGKQAFKKTAKKVTVKWGKVKGKQRTQLKKALKRAGMKVK